MAVTVVPAHRKAAARRRVTVTGTVRLFTQVGLRPAPVAETAGPVTSFSCPPKTGRTVPVLPRLLACGGQVAAVAADVDTPRPTRLTP